MKQNNREDLILDVISQALEKKVNRGCSYSYVGLDSYVNKTKVKDALNEKFALSLNESSLNFNNIGQLVDFIKPQIGWDVFHSYSDATDQILDVVSLVAGMKVIRGNSLGFAGLDNPASKTKLKNALNNTFNLSLTESSLDFNTVGQLVDALKYQIARPDSKSVTQDEGLPSNNSKSQDENSNELIVKSNMSKKYEWAITPDKTKHQYVIGIDFGHGETSAAYCSIGWDASKGQLSGVKDIDFGSNTKVIPSAISITTDDKAYIGDAAFLPEVLNKAEAKVCFKQKPESIDGAAEKLMTRFMKEVYNAIRERNSALFTEGNHLVYIATPSGWDDTAKDLYGQMATNAGLPMGGITSESRAAFIKAQQDPDSGLPQYIDKGAIVFDMGSSTLDFTYLTRDNTNPIDWGDDCGASKVEKIIYASKRDDDEEIIEFEKKYPNLVDALLFEARKAKEKVYFHPDMPCRITVNFETIVDDEEFEDTKMKFKYQPGELNQMLEEKGYIGAIRNAMMIFKNEKIAGKPIHVAFLTGGASRMDFIKDLVKECWGLPDDRIYRDQDPSLTISQGVAVLGRGDIRSGGSERTKDLLDEIVGNAQDIFTPFAESLTAKVTDEMQRSVITAFNEFRDCESDVSLNDLKDRMGQWIEQDANSIGEWATECYQQTFEEKTSGIREKLDSIVGEFSNSGVKMGSVNVSVSLPQLDMRELTTQMGDIGASFAAETGSISEAVTSVAISGAVGFGLGMLVGGPLAWILLGGYFVGKWLFGEEETEEQKKQKAMAKDLDKSARQQIYDAFFNEKWDEVEGRIANKVRQAVFGNTSLRKRINEQSSKVIREYAQECINQTRLMVE